VHKSEIKEIFCRPSEERALLAYCMQDIVFYYAVCARLSPEDFLYTQHENLMLIFSCLVGKNASSFEPNLVIAEASANNLTEYIGGPKYVQAIFSMNLKPENFDIYLDAVVEASIKYKLYNLLSDRCLSIIENAKDGASSVDLLGSAEASIMDLSVSKYNINEPINLGEDLKNYIESMRTKSIDMSGLSTGFPILDRQIDGMINGTLLVIAARKKMGKSAFLSNIAKHVAYIQKKPVLYVDTELTFEEWRPRILAAMSGVDEREIKHGGYDDETYNKLLRAESIISKGKLFHEYMPGYSVDKLVALYKKYKYKEDIGLIVFDYLKEPDSSSIDRQRKEYQLLGDITTKLKDLAGQLNIPALTAVQLNRDNDVADSDRIARYADVVAHWKHRPKDEIEEGGNDCGGYKLEIRDTRRGGATNQHGIGYNFFKTCLMIREVAVDKQYFANFNKVINQGDAPIDEFSSYDDQELS
jgi:replicative DNA helicase